MPKDPVIIIGMHRSGTTLLTKILEHHGLFIGKKKFGNEEAIFFQKINRWLLYQANTSWDHPASFAFVTEQFKLATKKALEWRIRSHHIKEYLGTAKALRYRNLETLDFEWGWKDPVNSITLDLWLDLFPKGKIVNIIRNPLDVAISLKEREENRVSRFSQRSKLTKRERRLTKKPTYNQSYRVLDLNEGVSLALNYMRINQQHLANFADQSIQLKYEDLLTYPEMEINRLAGFLGLSDENSLVKGSSSMVSKVEHYYKFLEDPAMIEVYEMLNLSPQFSEFGFHPPK